MTNLLPALRATIRARRLDRGFTLAQCAEQSGIALSQWARLETADRDISLSLLERVAPVLGWPLSRLMREAEKRGP